MHSVRVDTDLFDGVHRLCDKYGLTVSELSRRLFQMAILADEYGVSWPTIGLRLNQSSESER